MDVPFTPEEEAAIRSVASKSKISVVNLIKQALFGDKPIDLADFAPKEEVVRCRLGTQTIYSGGRHHRTAIFIPDDNLEEGDSYWTPQGRYVWSGRLDDKELNNMGAFIASPISGMGLHLIEDLVLVEIRAEDLASNWLKSLRRIQDAEALDQPLWPLAPDADLIDKCAAWLKWVQQNPQTPSETYRTPCIALGFTDEDHTDVRSALSWAFTAQSGYLIGDYPWPMMMRKE